MSYRNRMYHGENGVREAGKRERQTERERQTDRQRDSTDKGRVRDAEMENDGSIYRCNHYTTWTENGKRNGRVSTG